MVEIIRNKLEIPFCKFPLDIDRGKLPTFNSPLHRPPFEHAQDISSPVGKDVICPVNGKVLELRQYSTRWVPYKKGLIDDPNETLNWITIQIFEKGFLRRDYHKTPWILQMCHIQAYSSLNKVGDFIKKGEIVAKVGLNGIVTTTNGLPDTHLHIVIGKGLSIEDPFQNFQSYPIRFE